MIYASKEFKKCTNDQKKAIIGNLLRKFTKKELERNCRAYDKAMKGMKIDESV